MAQETKFPLDGARPTGRLRQAAAEAAAASRSKVQRATPLPLAERRRRADPPRPDRAGGGTLFSDWAAL